MLINCIVYKGVCFVVGSTTAGDVALRLRKNDFFWFIRQMVK